MFNRFKNAVIGVVGGLEITNGQNIPESSNYVAFNPKFPYGRPHFLNLGEEEVQMSADHKSRPIIQPSQALSYFAGYAECINAGKSKWNEDQAVFHQGVLTKIATNSDKVFAVPIPYVYYGLFDGHAGVGAALCAANQLHHILHEKLVDALDDIWLDFVEEISSSNLPPKPRDQLIIGALETAFRDIDQLIAEDRNKFQAAGGCTALVTLIILGKVYIANAGDSRAVVFNGDNYQPLSVDFTPENERYRIRRIAEEQPALLGKDFTHREYEKRPRSADLGKPIKYRDAHMKGWAYKTLQLEDLKLPVITGQGKRSRVMGTIGVTRGFGDHDLLAIYQKTPIKPFLSPNPEVQIYPLTKEMNESEIIVMATDGLWDVTSCKKAAFILNMTVKNFMPKERYISAATYLVANARGAIHNEHNWTLKEGKPASCDDISVFVIPLFPHKRKYFTFVEEYGNETPPNKCSNVD